MNKNFSREDFVNQNEIPVSLELVTNPKYAEIPTLAKILYSVLKYRVKLSARNRKKFEDENGLFIFFRQTDIAEVFGANLSTIKRWFKILQDNDLIEVVQQGLGKPSKIYVRNLPALENETPMVSEIEPLGTDETTEVSEMIPEESCDEYPRCIPRETSKVFAVRPPYSENEEMRIRDENKRESQKRHLIFEPPTFDEVQYFVCQNGWSFDAHRFYDHYQARGWKVNGSQIMDWRALCRSWSRKEVIFNPPVKQQQTADERWGIVSYGESKSTDSGQNCRTDFEQLPF